MNKRKLILTSGVANSFEWYDYALIGNFAPILGKKFFPDADPSAALLQVFLVFAVGYLMRPIGGVFFGIIGDKFGRKSALSTAIMCMAVPTAAIGFLPTYETLGISATILMVIFRMLQGLSMGGALTGSIAFVIEHSPKEHRGALGSVAMSSICIGILLGSLVAFATQNLFTTEQFEDWAWRVPFIIGIAVYFAGIYIKNNTKETPLFEEAKAHCEIAKTPLRTAFRYHWFDMLMSFFINATGSVIFYIEAIYLASYLKINRGFPESDVGILITCCYIIMIFVTLFAGWLSDKIGRRKIFILNLLFIIAVIPFLMEVMENGTFTAVIGAQVIIAIIAATYIGPEPALQAEFYPTSIRNTALSISYNTGTSVFGGTAPYIMESLVQNTNTITSSVYYIITCAFVSLAALYFYKDKSSYDRAKAIDDT
ncbi:MAG: MFS transporter [Rickettsiales bacterium]|nr:MAG: MFS transporter [Rickettsiales bacterium]